jgi:phosphate-selective porin OprO/OprP
MAANGYRLVQSNCGNTRRGNVMKLRGKKKVLVATALVALATPQATARADDIAAEIRLLKARVRQLEPLKEQLKRLEEKLAKQDRKQKETEARVHTAGVQPGMGGKDAPCPPPPVFVSFKNGLKVESFDHDFSFRIGGYVFVDGGGSTQPELGKSGNVNITRARLQLEGKAFKYWDYKLQYDFAGNTTLATPTGATTTPAGGIRDAYVALKHPVLAFLPFTSDPVVLQLGNFFEPMGLERTNSLLFTDFIQRAMVSDAFGPSRHLGIAALVHGDNWSAKGGIFSTSVEDRALTPSAGIPALPFPASAVATGGGQYYDLSGRVTFAPIKEKDALLHFGGSARYQRPNDATGLSDNRVMLLGSNVNTEANVVGENLLGTPDLSCGVIPSAAALAARAVAGKCVSDLVDYGAEFVAAYGPFSVQAEYMGAHYNRNRRALAFANTHGVFAPGGTSLNFSGYYVYATWYFTGESRAEAYQTDDLNPATFRQIKILTPLSAGGIGAWEIGARFSELNLNLNLNDAGIQGGRETDFTLGLNWYPDPGFRLMWNWVNVLQLAAPFDRPYLNGIHPNIFVMRTQVNW